MMKLFSLTLIMSLFLAALSSAQSKIDSLEIALEKANNDSLRIVILHQLFDEYWYESPDKARDIILEAIDLSNQTDIGYLKALGLNIYADYLSSQASYDSSIVIYEKALKMAEEVGYDVGKAEALIGLGNDYWRKGNYQKAMEYQELNIEFSEQINDQDGVASSYNNIGNIYNEIGDYAKAMEYYTLSSKKYDQLGDEKNVAITLANIGLINQHLENYQEAIDYFGRSDSTFKKLDFQPGRAFVLKNLGIIYKNMGDFDQSVSYNLKAMESHERMGNRHQIGQIQVTIGNLYYEQKNYGDASKYYRQAMEVSTEIGDSSGIGVAYQSLGRCYYQLGNNQEAEELLFRAIDVGTTIGTPLTVMNAYETLSMLYADRADFANAYESKNQYTILRDSLYTREKRDLAREIEAKYQNDQKGKEIALLESENELQALQIQKRETERNYLIAFAITILLLAGLGYNQYRIKQKANAKLKELDHLKSDFFANISHEFRTPLSLIMAPLKEKIGKSENDKERSEYQMMYRNADRLFNLINQLLDLSKLEAGNIRLERSAVETNHFFRIITASFSSLAEYKKINFQSNITGGEDWLEFDQDIIQKVCYNLLSNAFKFTPEEGEVNFTVKVEKEKLKITVSDSGSGIPWEEQEKVFNRFYQSSSAKQLGTGIGLALTKELVEFHQGTVTFQSETGKGSKFMVEIPVTKVDATSNGKEPVYPDIKHQDTPASTQMETVEASKGPIILIIEDNPDLRNYLDELLHGAYTIYKSPDGVSGIEKAREIVPDLIISDVMMPEMDGMEVCKQLKTAKETDHIPIILLTARADQQSKLEGLTTGADDYLLKPFDPEELKIRISNLLEQRSRLKKRYAGLLLLQPTEIEISSAQESFLKTVMEVVDKHIDNSEFSTTQFSSELGMSRMQLHRKLTALTGYSANAFLRQQRLGRATQLLAAGEPVSQVAYAVGFGNLSYFSKIFKEEYGVVPSDYTKTKT